MSALREAPDAARQLLAAIGRELARADKHRRTYAAAGRPDAAAKLARRMRMLARLHDEAALQVDPTARIVSDDDSADATDEANPIVLSPNGSPGAIVSSPNGPAPKRTALSHVDFPAMTAAPIDEADLLDGLV